MESPIRVVKKRDALKSKGKPIYRGLYDSKWSIKAEAVTPIMVTAGIPERILQQEKEGIMNYKNIKDLEKVEIDIFENRPPSYDGKYFIPGSSIKGAVRFRAEMMFKSLNNKSISCYRIYSKSGKPSSNYVKIYGSQVFEERPGCEIDEYDGEYKVCEVCDIFGAPKLIAKVAFSDFIANTDNVRRFEIGGEEYFGFDKGTIFEGYILLNSNALEDYQLGLLLAAMRVCENKPILFGRLKYKKVDGLKFGLLKFKIDNLGRLEIEKYCKAFRDVLGDYYRDDLDETKFFANEL